jgi:hypothetical protein
MLKASSAIAGITVSTRVRFAIGSERLTGALLDRLTHHVHILAMNGESYRLAQSIRRRRASSSAADIRP